MSPKHVVRRAGAAALGLFVASAALAQPADLKSGLLVCRAMSDLAARAGCYDRLVDALNPPPAMTNAAPPRAAPSAPSPPLQAATPRLAPPAARFGADDLPENKRNPDAPPVPDQIIAKAASVRTDGSGFVTVTLDNGQTWRQTDGPALRVLPGAEVKIRSGLIGSYLMSLTSGNRSVRAKRVN